VTAVMTITAILVPTLVRLCSTDEASWTALVETPRGPFAPAAFNARQRVEKSISIWSMVSL
jgi:hypothetical protein